MALSIFTQADLYEMIDGNVHQKFSQVNDRQVTVNRTVRFVQNDIDLRSAKRIETLAPNLFNDVYGYTAPPTMKMDALIDLRRQRPRASFEKFFLVDEVEFDRKKGRREYIVSVSDDDLGKILRIDGVKGTTRAVIHNMNSVTANGTWAVGTDASNITADTNNYIFGGASLNFDMAAGAATGFIELTGATQIDLTNHDEVGSIFVWVFIPDYSDAQGDTVTNFILRWGNDSSVFWSRTVTTTNEGETFHDGWQLLRFDWNGATETGTVNPAQIDYVRFTVTKSTSLAADTDWRVDDIIARVGDIYDVIFYSKFGWTDSAGVYIEESSATTDLVVAHSDEIEIIAAKASEYASQELKELQDVQYFNAQYEQLKRRYRGTYPSERMKRQNFYYRMKSPNFRNLY